MAPPKDEVTNISVFPIKPPMPGADLGNRAWVSLSCRGSLVINLTPLCTVTDTYYTRADCRFEGVPRH